MKELVPDAEPIQGLGDFYDFLWGEQDGYVYLPNKDRSTDQWKKIMFHWPEDRSKVINYTLATDAGGRDVYAAPAIFKSPSPLKDNILGSYTLWVDFDGNAPSEWASSDVPVSEQEPGSDGLNGSADALAPTLRIKSSKVGHEHTYWRFDELITDIEYIDATNRAMAYKYEADTSGWDANQVLRPPHTINHKNNLPVVVEASTDRSYTKDHFSAFKRVKQVVVENIKITETPSVESIIARYVWDDRTFKHFMQTEVEEGKRSSALMALGHFGAETGMSDNEIYALLVNADDRWGKFKGRTDRERRLLDIISRARIKHPVGGETNELAGLLGSSSKVEEAPQFVFGFREFNQLDIKLEWIIEGLLERQGMGLIASAPGVGKTQFCLGLGIACATGADFLIWHIPRPMKILWFSLEMIAPALQYFTKQMTKRYGEEEQLLLDQNLLIVPLGEVLPLDKPEGRKFMEALIEEYKPDGIIIDSMGKVTNSSLNDEEKIKGLNAYYGFLRKKHDLFIWFVHHNRKANGDNKKPKDLQDIYGSQYIAADVTSALSLWKDDDGLELNVIKTRLSAQPDPIRLERTETLHFIMNDDTFAGLVEVADKEDNSVTNGRTTTLSTGSLFEL